MTNKIAISYLIATAIYFCFGGGSMWWNGFNMATLLIPLYYFMGYTRPTKWTRLAQNVTVIRGIYTLVCMAWPSALIYPMNKALSIVLVAVIILRWSRKN